MITTACLVLRACNTLHVSTSAPLMLGCSAQALWGVQVDAEATPELEEHGQDPAIPALQHPAAQPHTIQQTQLLGAPTQLADVAELDQLESLPGDGAMHHQQQPIIQGSHVQVWSRWFTAMQSEHLSLTERPPAVPVLSSIDIIKEGQPDSNCHEHKCTWSIAFLASMIDNS